MGIPKSPWLLKYQVMVIHDLDDLGIPPNQTSRILMALGQIHQPSKVLYITMFNLHIHILDSPTVHTVDGCEIQITS